MSEIKIVSKPRSRALGRPRVGLLGWLRRLGYAFRRARSRIGISQRFLIVSVVIVAFAMIGLGASVSHKIGQSISQGVATMAATGMDALISHSIEGISPKRQLSAEDRQQLDSFFEIGGDATSARLVQVRIWRLDGTLLYEASQGVPDSKQQELFDLASTGTISSDLVNVALNPVGPIDSHPLSLLRLYTPLHRPGTDEIFAVATLYYSARAVSQIQFDAQLSVWATVLFTGLVVIAALYAFVASANGRMLRQGVRLSRNLAESRRLSDEVRNLHAASEKLRMDAIEANENLLARVGSDIHDGPLQLLTLILLQLSRWTRRPMPKSTDVASTMSLTTDAMTDLRNISAGLVLPELQTLTLAAAIDLAAMRHEQASGTRVRREIEDLDLTVESGVQICVYRVIQEALSNAFRHGDGVDQVVSARHSGEMVVVEVTNTVRGTREPVGQSVNRPKLGLRGMQLRAEAVGGALTAELSDARVVVRLQVPSAAFD